MLTKKVELLKVRDFGEIITDSFIFARQNYKPLIKCFFVFCGFFMLAGALLLSLHQAKTINGMASSFGDNTPLADRFSSILGPDCWIGVFLLVIAALSLQVSMLSYVAFYKEKGNMPASVEEVWGYVKYFFLRIFGGNSLVFLLCSVAIGIVFGLLYAISSSNSILSIFLTFLLCIVPAVYLSPIFSLIFPIIVFENGSFGYAFNRSFKIIKNNWWATFGAIIVMGLIIWVASFIVLLPVIILSIINLLMHFGRGTPFSMVITVITSVFEALSRMLYIVPII